MDKILLVQLDYPTIMVTAPQQELPFVSILIEKLYNNITLNVTLNN